MLSRFRLLIGRLRDRVRRGPELHRLAARVQKLETTLRDVRRKRDLEHASLKRESSSRHRRVLSPEIVRDLLPLRFQTLAARTAYWHAGQAEAGFARSSAAYRQALTDIEKPVEGLVRADFQGLQWWIPAPEDVGDAARERLIGKQRFPYRNITQTREFALGPVMLDIGANTGRMSIPRVILGDVVRAYCAEPDPLNYAALVHNVVGNGLRGLVLPDRVAIAASSGTGRLRHAKYSGGHRLVAGEDSDSSIDVACVRLDDWCEQLSLDPSLVTYVKVDTQGWEAEVLKGASRLLRHRHIAWQLEISPGMLGAAGTGAHQLYEMCIEHFRYFIDLGKRAEGPRARPTLDLRDSLTYLSEEDAQTDILLFNSATRGD